MAPVTHGLARARAREPTGGRVASGAELEQQRSGRCRPGALGHGACVLFMWVRVRFGCSASGAESSVTDCRAGFQESWTLSLAVPRAGPGGFRREALQSAELPGGAKAPRRTSYHAPRELPTHGPLRDPCAESHVRESVDELDCWEPVFFSHSLKKANMARKLPRSFLSLQFFYSVTCVGMLRGRQAASARRLVRCTPLGCPHGSRLPCDTQRFFLIFIFEIRICST